MAGGHAGGFFESAVEGGQAGKTGIKGDINNMGVLIPEQHLCVLDTFGGKERQKGRIGVLLEKIGKVGFTDSHLFCNHFEGQGGGCNFAK